MKKRGKLSIATEIARIGLDAWMKRASDSDDLTFNLIEVIIELIKSLEETVSRIESIESEMEVLNENIEELVSKLKKR